MSGERVSAGVGGHQPGHGAAQRLGLRLEKGAGWRWAEGCRRDSADLGCLPCPEHPRSPQPGCHPSRGFRPVPGAVGRGTGEELWVRTSAPSPVPLCSPSLPCHCISPCGEDPSWGVGGRHLVAAPELLIAANALGAFKPSPFGGRFLPFEVCFPSPGSLGHLISLSQLCSQHVLEPLDKP